MSDTSHELPCQAQSLPGRVTPNAESLTCALQQLEKGTLAPVDTIAALKDQTSAVDENFPVGSRSCNAGICACKMS